MAKRRAASLSDDERTPASSAASNSKRARVDDASDDDDVVESSPPPAAKRAKNAAKTNGKRKARDGDESDDDDGDDDDMNAEDEKFELEHTEEIRRRIQAKVKTAGEIAESGIIESLDMHQFMCHANLGFKFGPQVNFIIGHNGSGKSAVLTGITVALGGKATTTGRGSGLKSFIREGQKVAEVTIVLKNRGEDAYKPDIFGKSIGVTRRFTKDGSSTWKIKDENGKVISTKREDLSAICDHMNIQVDNPMNVLTQDSARAFLSASSPADKYKFFLKGTQLSQLSDEYNACLENINQTARILDKKREAIPDLRNAFKEASDRFQEAEKALDMKNKIDGLKKEMAWSHIRSKEEELAKKLEEVAKHERRLPKSQTELDKANADFDKASEKVGALEQEMQNLGDIDHLNNRKKELQDTMRKNKQELSRIHLDEKEMNDNLKQLNKAIADAEKNIKIETQKMEADTKEKRDETKRKLDAAEADLRAADERLSSILEQKRGALEAQAAARDAGKAAGDARQRRENELMGIEEQIARLQQSRSGALDVYGRNMGRVLEQIQQMRWHGNAPVGPFGRFVKVREPEQWAPLLRNQIGGLMFRFAVTDARDRAPLRKLLEESGTQGIDIIISEYDLFDYSSGEPPADMPTVLRQIEVSDPYVLRVMINAAQIERTLIARKRVEADSMLRSLGGGGVAWSADMFRVQKYAEGGGMSNPLSTMRNNDPRQNLFTGTDPAAQLRHWEQKRHEIEPELQTAREHERLNAKKFQDATNELKQLTNEEQKAVREKGKKKLARDNARNEANQEVPAGISGLEEYKQDQEADKAKLLEQFTELAATKANINREQAPLLQQLNELRAQISEHDEHRQAMGERVGEAVNARLVAQNAQVHYRKKMEEDKAKVEEAKTEAAALEDTFKEWVAKAEAYCDKVHDARKVEVVERELKSMQAALKEREKKQGATVEDIVVDVNKAQAALINAEKELKQMSLLNKSLTKSLLIRLEKWDEFRRHIALRTKITFQFNLSHRGYFGKVMFDHLKQTLSLKVQTEDKMMAATQSKEKDPKSLSGGEKSFSTICLLLALWEAIGCPIRCLDEFDVFMDAVNRRISMKMMIDTAQTSHRKQYILITPQDMTNVTIGPSVRVNRMPDPERGQGTLAFGK